MQTRQTSFAAGELSPLLHGRADLDLYAQGARGLLNYVVNRQGSAVSRPGFKLAWASKAGQCILVPFLHPTGESYVLEFGALYARLYNARTFALVGEVATPFQVTDLDELQYAQFGRLLVLTHRLRPPQELTVDAAGMTLQEARFGPPGETPTDAPLQPVMPSIGGNPPALPALVSWGPDALFELDAAHPWREWRYKVSTLVRHRTTGEKAETLAADITKYVEGSAETGSYGPSAGLLGPLDLGDERLVLAADAPIYVAPGEGQAVAASTNWEPTEYLYYRGRGTLFGLVGSSRDSGLFADFADEPNWAIPPLRGESPFSAGEHPRCVAFFAARRIYGGSDARPSTLWMSAVNSWTNYDKPVVPWSGQPLEATLLDRKRERIMALAQAEHLVVLTDTSVWVLGRNDTPLDYDTLPNVLRKLDDVGAQPLQALDVDGAIVYARSRGRGVRAVQRAQNVDSLDAADISWHAEHLFRGTNKRIVSWCYQREPWHTFWVVFADGTLASCSRTATGSWAWARHEVNGVALSVCSVPEADTSAARGDSDLVFLAVERMGRMSAVYGYSAGSSTVYVECLTPQVTTLGVPGVEQQSYPLDSYVVATFSATADTVVTGLGHLEGREVWCACPGIEPVGPFTVRAGAITVPFGWKPEAAVTTFRAAVGLKYQCDLELLDAAGARMGQMTVTKVAIDVDSAQGLKVGQSSDALVPWRQRRVADSYGFPPPAGEFVVVEVKGTWNRTGRAFLRQDLPLPVTVLGVMRELEKGGT